MDLEIRQLPLQIGLKDDCLFDTYYPGDNAQALFQIQQTVKGIGEHYVYLWGREGVGKTHLLQGACHYANGLQLSSLYLSFKGKNLDNPALLEGLERVDLICWDDIEAVAGLPHWEEALFHCFNRIREQGKRLIIASHVAPKALPLLLPDLQSRLSWGVVYPLTPLEDEQLLCAIQLRAHQRGLHLPDEVGMFLIRRLSRSMLTLTEILGKLDEASLAAQRKLTIPFIKAILSL